MVQARDQAATAAAAAAAVGPLGGFSLNDLGESVDEVAAGMGDNVGGSLGTADFGIGALTSGADGFGAAAGSSDLDTGAGVSGSGFT